MNPLIRNAFLLSLAAVLAACQSEPAATPPQVAEKPPVMAQEAKPAQEAPAAVSQEAPVAVSKVDLPPPPPPMEATRSEISRSGTGSKWGAGPSQVSRRLDTVNTLIEKSSGAKRILGSGNPQAMAMRGQAIDLKNEAKKAMDGGDYETASTRLGEATRTMFAAIKLADGGAVKEQKAHNDFENRLKSVKVLLDAHDRIAKEKGLGSSTSNEIASLMGKAQSLNQSGNTEAGRVELDKAYVVAKLAIEKMRRGEQLVRSLNFASKEEEYHYEVDRNDTHQMLVKMLLQDKDSATTGMVQKYVDAASGLRTQAESAARGGQFEKAIQILEESTKELIRAIRGAGIYIPS